VVRFPDGGAACVALAETTPQSMTVGGVGFAGVALRYVRAHADLNDLSGLGVAHVDGVADFAEPTTFRLRRDLAGCVRLTTGAGVTLKKEWLGGVRRIDALALSGDWVDVTKACGSCDIPAGVVREWAGRNERTLVDFRLSR